MGIQIDEKLLSPVAKNALSNAKSKSKLLREALEAYVRLQPGSTQTSSNDELSNLKDELKEIKELLYMLTASGLEFKPALETKIVDNIEKAPKIIHEDLKNVTDQQSSTVVNKPISNNKKEETKVIDTKKLEIEKALESSLLAFDIDEYE